MPDNGISRVPTLVHVDAWTAAVNLAASLAVALAFAAERTTFLNIPFHLFWQAQHDEIAIQNYRFVSALTQWLPLALLRLEIAMAGVQLGYSVIFVALYAAAYSVARYALGARAVALAFAAVWLVFCTHTHYWIQSELPQGLAVLTIGLAVAVADHRFGARDLPRLLCVQVAFVTVAFAHPLLIVPTLFALGFVVLYDRAHLRWCAWASGVYAAAYAARVVWFSTPYDASAGGGLRDSLAALLDGHVPYSLPHLAGQLSTTYLAFVAVTAVGIVAFWRGGRRLIATYTAVGILAHLGLVALSYPGESVRDFYIENLYLPAGWMACLATAYAWERASNYALRRSVAYAVLAVALLRAGAIVYVGIDTYRPRLATLEGLLERHAGEKVFLPETTQLTNDLIMTWGVSYEAWVASARAGRPTQGLIVASDPEPYRWALDDPERLVLYFSQPTFGEVDNVYTANPSPTPYRIIPTK